MYSKNADTLQCTYISKTTNDNTLHQMLPYLQVHTSEACKTLYLHTRHLCNPRRQTLKLLMGFRTWLRTNHGSAASLPRLSHHLAYAWTNSVTVTISFTSHVCYNFFSLQPNLFLYLFYSISRHLSFTY